MWYSWAVPIMCSSFFADGQTEAEINNFNLTGLPLLGIPEAEELAEILAMPELSILGKWRLNITYLMYLNSQLVTDGFVVIPDFLDGEVALELYNDVLSARSEFARTPTSVGLSFNETLPDMKLYFEDDSPASRCKCMATGSFKFRMSYLTHHNIEAPRHKHATLMNVSDALESAHWDQAINLLSTGTGMRLLNTASTQPRRTTMPLQWREFRSGDYQLLHMDAYRNRSMTFNFWLSSPGWLPKWGGNMLWCGRGEVPLADQGSFEIIVSWEDHQDPNKFHGMLDKAAASIGLSSATVKYEYLSFTDVHGKVWRLDNPVEPPTSDMFPLRFQYRPPPAESLFPNAVRISPAFNQAILFLPHTETGHAVEVVESHANPSYHRFSFTSWRQIEGLDGSMHYRALAERAFKVTATTSALRKAAAISSRSAEL